MNVSQLLDTLIVQMRQRINTTANWPADEVLARGEIGVEVDSFNNIDANGEPAAPTYAYIKIGDGRTPWSELPYSSKKVQVVFAKDDKQQVITGNTIVDASFEDIGSAYQLTLTKGNRVIPTGAMVANQILLGDGNESAKSSGVTIAKTLGTDDNTIPTSAAVRTYVDAEVRGATQYFGVINTKAELDQITADPLLGHGDFIRIGKSFEIYHAGDMLIWDKPTTASAGSWKVVQGEHLEAGDGINIVTNENENRIVSLKTHKHSASYQPAGTVSAPTFEGDELTSSGSFTPSGKVAAPTITTTPSTIKINSLTSQGTLPSFDTTYNATTQHLTFTWGAGTLPEAAEKEVMNGVTATASAPTFTGTQATVKVKGTPSGTITAPTFTGTQTTITTGTWEEVNNG